MTAIKMDRLKALEKEHGLSPDGLSYQHRCSRMTAYLKGEGESWEPPVKEPDHKAPESQAPDMPYQTGIETHPLYGKRILITPLMRPDAKRALAYDEPLGPEIEVRDFNAGEQIYGASEDVQRMVGDYEVVRTDPTRQVIAKTTFPKIGTEISWMLGKELVPVVHGNDNQRGYIWSFPTSTIQVDDTIIQMYGLKTLISQIYPELLGKFKDKPMMTYVDGVTLVASIPMTHALLKEHRRKELMDAKVGLV